jgi:tRNA threonylcarbamoyladenosine biosynthesis protein TsaE
MKIALTNLSELPEAARKLLDTFNSSRVFAFHGELGAGKTTFIKAACKELGVNDPMSSPSFGIVNEYHRANKESVYHFDLYRLKQLEEAYDIGLPEYLDSGSYCFIEWPEKAEAFLPEETIHVTIRELNGLRELMI